MELPEVLSDFKTSLLGGAWTMRHKGVAADAMKGMAVSPDAKEYCSQLHMQEQVSFYFSTYGEGLGAQLALLWWQRMQYFMQLYQSSGGTSLKPSPEEINSAPTLSSQSQILLDALPAKAKARASKYAKVSPLQGAM